MLAQWSESCVVDEKSLICPVQTTRLGASADWFNPVSRTSLTAVQKRFLDQDQVGVDSL
jgi:hypothetical protein